jgi:hypothetical protein
MTGNSSAAAPETFNESLLECVEDINKLLPRLGRRYDMTVVMSALAEHVGSALKALLMRKVCDAQQVRKVLDNIETSTFLRKSTQAKAEGTPEDADETPPAAGGSKPPDSDP